MRASLSHSVFSSPQQSSTKSASLSMAHQSIIQFPLSTLLFMNKAPRLLHLRQQVATQSEPRTMVPYLAVLILFQPLYTQSNVLLIPENHIVFKSANTNLTPPDTPMSWILQNIKRSIKVMYRGSAKGKPWWISTSTGNELYLFSLQIHKPNVDLLGKAHIHLYMQLQDKVLLQFFMTMMKLFLSTLSSDDKPRRSLRCFLFLF